MLHSSSERQLLGIVPIVILQLSLDVTVILNVNIARQVLGFVYLLIVPGVLILRALQVNRLGSVETVLYSVGLSIASVMLLGLGVNQVGSFLAIPTLSTMVLLLIMNAAVFVLCAIVFFLGSDIGTIHFFDLSLASLSTACFPVLSIVGTILANATGRNEILLLMIGVTALFFLLNTAKAKAKMPLALFMIGLALLLQTSLVSNNIVGYDIHLGYHVFSITQNTGVWNSITNETDPLVPRTNQMLSVTILPTVYSELLGLDEALVLKVVFVFLFALMPVGLFQLYRKYVESRIAFAAAFLTFASLTFMAEMPGLPTQMIGELFLVLLLIVLFSSELSHAKKTIFLTVFAFGMIVSHYGISYIFILLLLLAWLFLALRKKQTNLHLPHIMLFFSITCLWYVYTSRSASFDTFVQLGQSIYSSFWTDLINPQSRANTALVGVGLGGSAVSVGHWMGRIFHYATQVFIVLGVILVASNRIQHRFDKEYVFLSSCMLVFLVAPLVAPSFGLMNMTRTYHIALLFLAPFCILGGVSFFSFLIKRFSARKGSFVALFLISVVVCSLFLFETGFVYEITKDVSYSVPLSMYRMDKTLIYGYEYLSKQLDVAGALWLRSSIAMTNHTSIYGDIVSIIKSPLTSYAAFPLDHMLPLSNVTTFAGTSSYVYLRAYNVANGVVIGESQYQWNTSDLKPVLGNLHKVYANGGSEIYSLPNTSLP